MDIGKKGGNMNTKTRKVMQKKIPTNGYNITDKLVE